MYKMKKALVVLSLAAVQVTLTGFGSTGSTPSAQATGEAISRHIAMLRIGKAQQKAAAAYWLGQQHSAAAVAVDPLVELLGDVSEINPAQYRSSRALQKLTVGEEAAAALVKIGHSAIDPLIRVLKNSPDPEARKNAAWALGALHDTGATTTEI
jgi:HEAT repeat protein